MSTLPIHLEWSLQGQGCVQELYRSMQTKGLLGKMYAFISGHSRNLRDLAAEVSERKIRSQHYAGSQTVLIDRIKGSEGRSSDFDSHFNPLHTRTFDRWMSIAVARSSGDILPLIELIQLDEYYFVRDGHHRLSVARAFGEEYIDAMVIVLELEPSFDLSINTDRSERTYDKWGTCIQQR